MISQAWNGACGQKAKRLRQNVSTEHLGTHKYYENSKQKQLKKESCWNIKDLYPIAETHTISMLAS